MRARVMVSLLAAMAVVSTICAGQAAAKKEAAVSQVQYSVRNYGARGDGRSDDSPAFQSAIDEAFLAGGGVVFVPGSPKGYSLGHPILVRPGVTLRGIHAGPSDAHFLAANDALESGERSVLPPVPGGILIAQDDHPAVTLAENSGVDGLTFSYPDQTPYTAMPIKAYPPLLQVRGFGRGAVVPGVPRTHGIKTDGPISGRSVTIRSIGALNAYHILDIVGEYPTKYQVAQITVDGLWGYPLSCGVNIQNSLDTVMLHNVQFRPTFFGPACPEISKSAIGFALGKSDGCVISDCLIFGLGIGVLHRNVEKSYDGFSMRANNLNIEAMIPIWVDSHAVDDQVQYTNSFLFHCPFAFKPAPGMVYSRKGHRLFPDLTYSQEETCCVRVSNRREEPTFQSYARFVGCGFHAYGAGQICLVEGNQLVRVMMSSSHMVYFHNSVLRTAPGAKVLATITGNDIMLYGTGLARGVSEGASEHLLDIGEAGPGTAVIFSDNMLQGGRREVIDELSSTPGVTANGNAAP